MTETSVSYILWAHHVNDPSWENVSYIRVFECSSPTEFWQMFNSLHNSLKQLFQQHMLFLMKSVNGHEIYPKWEDEHNINGGCWSLRIDHSIAYETFKMLAIHFVTNTLSRSETETNGISMAPKASHSIIKVWMQRISKTGDEWYTPLASKSVPLLTKAVFQIHNNNIKRDYRRKSLFQTNRTKRPHRAMPPVTPPHHKHSYKHRNNKDRNNKGTGRKNTKHKRHGQPRPYHQTSRQPFTR